MARREYPVELKINEKLITKVVIDPHYEEKHAESVTGIVNAYRRENK